jgi:hypothetical protein
MPKIIFELDKNRLLDLTPLIKEEYGKEYEIPTCMRNLDYQNITFDEFWNERRTLYFQPLSCGGFFILYCDPPWEEGYAMLISQKEDKTFSIKTLATYKKYTKFS